MSRCIPSIGTANFGQDQAMLWNPSALDAYPGVHASRSPPAEQRLVSSLSTDWIDCIPYFTAETAGCAFDELFHARLGVRWASR
jgi:hypothetical protein